jgi:hypothetical protein
MQDEASAPPEQTEPSALLANTSNGAAQAPLAATERAAIVARQDAGTATRGDWTLWQRDLDRRLAMH